MHSKHCCVTTVLDVISLINALHIMDNQTNLLFMNCAKYFPEESIPAIRQTLEEIGPQRAQQALAMEYKDPTVALILPLCRKYRRRGPLLRLGHPCCLPSECQKASYFSRSVWTDYSKSRCRPQGRGRRQKPRPCLYFGGGRGFLKMRIRQALHRARP